MVWGIKIVLLMLAVQREKNIIGKPPFPSFVVILLKPPKLEACWRGRSLYILNRELILPVDAQNDYDFHPQSFDPSSKLQVI